MPTDTEPTPPPSSGDVAVVICAYTDERWDDIAAAIESVHSQTLPCGEIVLVVDHNDSLLARAVERFSDDSGSSPPPSVTIVANRHRTGLSGARNTGIESTTKPIVAFLDDDAFAHPDWLANLVEPYADASVVGVGGYIEPAWETARPRWWPFEFDWVIGCSYTGLPITQRRVRNPIGANMSVRRRAFGEVGGFSSMMGRVGKNPAGCEETEMFVRIHKAIPTSIILYEPTAKVSHRVPASRATFSYFVRRCYADGQSKALLSQLPSGSEKLAAEWSYTLKTLPLGFLRALRNAAPDRAAMIVVGLVTTIAGYVRGRADKGPERNLTKIPDSSETA